jgi:hypothetical protein
MNDPRALYLDLLKKCLTNTIYLEGEACHESGIMWLMRKLGGFLRIFGLRPARLRSINPDVRAEGSDWPTLAHTMIGMKRLDALQHCVSDVLNKDVPGDLIETGVWRGGASIFMRGILKAYGSIDRTVWVADSFEGLPPPNPDAYPADQELHLEKYDQLAVSLEQVRANFERYGLLDSQVRFLKGWFKDVLPSAPIDRLAIARLDGDLYESTMDALKSLYPKLSIGGYLLVDDFGGIPACRKAVEDYRGANGIDEEIVKVDWTGVYWQRRK